LTIEELIMSQITIHIHPELARWLLAEGKDGARAVAAISRQALRIVQVCGWHIAYAPVVLPDGTGCAMSARGGMRGLIVEIDPAGTLIPGRGVVRALKTAEPGRAKQAGSKSRALWR
jgi:hypothetical protein